MVREFLNPPALNYTAKHGAVAPARAPRSTDGKPWLMRALCYSPVPVGWDPDWFEPYGDFFTSEYAGIYERDIPLIAAAGINTLRIYTLKYSHRHTHFFETCALAVNQHRCRVPLRGRHEDAPERRGVDARDADQDSRAGARGEAPRGGWVDHRERVERPLEPVRV